MTRYDPTKHHRRSIRLPDYDYTSPGAYFVTICVHGGECLLGDVVGGEMRLNDWGRVVRHYWQRIPRHAPHVRLDAWVVMPNHLHGIIVVVDAPRPRGEASPASAFSEEGPGTDGPPSRREGVTWGEASPASAFSEEGPGTDGPPPRREGVTWGEASPVSAFPEEGIGTDGPLPRREGVPRDASPLQTPAGPRSGSLGAMVGNFKSVTTRRINRMRKMPGIPFWQRNYWEHIIRNESSLNRIRAYIQTNPIRWQQDQLHPGAPPNRFNQW